MTKHIFSIVAAVTLVLGGAIAVPGAAGAATPVQATAQSVKGTVASTTVAKGASVKATLTAKPATNGVAKLQYKSGGTWKTHSRSITVKAGKGTATLKPPADRTYRFSYGGKVSNAFTVKVKAASVKAKVASMSVAKGASVKATLTATPATNGVAKLQYKSGGTWKTDSRSITMKAGKGTATLKPPTDRSYRFAFAGGVSNAVTVKVTEAKPKAAASVKGTAASASIVKGGSVKATLTATPATNGVAKLQYKTGDTWKTDTRSITVKVGKATTTLKPPADRSYRFSYAGVVSNAFTVKVVVPSVKGTVASTSVVKGGSVTATLNATPATSGTAQLQYKSGGTWVTHTRSVTVKAGKGTTALKPSADRTYRFLYSGVVSNEFSVKVTTTSASPGSFTVTGSGWGHGVGMSQYGAYGMALKGSTASQILTHYYTGTKVETLPVGPSDLRVQVFGSGTDNANSVNLIVRSTAAGDGQWRMRFYTAASDPNPAVTWTGTKNEDLIIGRSGATISVTRANGAKASGALVTVHWEGTRYYQATSAENAYVELLAKKGGSRATHGQYRHGRMLITSRNDRINVVNSLDLNTEYLNGVAEVPSSWHASVLEAQAVTARGYALRNLNAGTKAACACHVYDDTRSQNFSGWLKENEGTNAVYGKRWVAAVRATSNAAGTSGQVLTYGAGGAGRIATTYYFSSSGGQTENSEHVWSSTVSYLRAVSDPWSLDAAVKNSNASWTATLTQAKAASAFGLPNVVKIVITSRTSSATTAAAYKVTATSSTGATSTITGADNVRIKLGIKSPWVWTIRAN